MHTIMTPAWVHPNKQMNESNLLIKLNSVIKYKSCENLEFVEL